MPGNWLFGKGFFQKTGFCRIGKKMGEALDASSVNDHIINDDVNGLCNFDDATFLTISGSGKTVFLLYDHAKPCSSPARHASATLPGFATLRSKSTKVGVGSLIRAKPCSDPRAMPGKSCQALPALRSKSAKVGVGSMFALNLAATHA